MRDVTGAPYYVNKYICDGKRCRYMAIKVTDIVDIATTEWSIKVSDATGDILTVTNEDIGTPSSISEAAQAIYDAMSIANGTETPFINTTITPGLDIVCVTLYDSIGIIYARHGYTMTLDNNDKMNYLMDGGDIADIYMLCRNISLNFGACKVSEGGKYSNIYSGIKKDIVEGETVITWPTGSIPLIMNNCKLCEYCISNCPRKAIMNKINDKPISMRELSLDPGSDEYDQLYRQYYLNSHAVDGSEIYS